jgi:RNA polymerase sigma-70 factor (ECF subfamily)
MKPPNSSKEFEELTLPLGADLFRLAYWRLANKQDAEDVVQETYLRGFRSFHTFAPGSNIKSWMTRILFNVINDLFRKRRRQTDIITLDETGDEIASMQAESATLQDPQDQVMDAEIQPDLLEALRRLPTSLLYPLLLRELEEMTYQEIATILDIPVGTVMSRLFRARRIVRDYLTENPSKISAKNSAENSAGGSKADLPKQDFGKPEVADHGMQ